MITGEIKKYDEPLPAWQVTTYAKQETPAEREAWLTKCAEALDKAKQIIQIGDRIICKNNQAYNLVVLNFIEDVEKMQKYQNNPCVIEAHNPTFINAKPIQYSLEELDLTTLVRKEEPNV